MTLWAQRWVLWPSPGATVAALRDTGQFGHEHPRASTHLPGELEISNGLAQRKTAQHGDIPCHHQGLAEEKTVQYAKGW